MPVSAIFCSLRCNYQPVTEVSMHSLKLITRKVMRCLPYNAVFPKIFFSVTLPKHAYFCWDKQSCA
jgi:hypothetical protein